MNKISMLFIIFATSWSIFAQSVEYDFIMNHKTISYLASVAETEEAIRNLPAQETATEERIAKAFLLLRYSDVTRKKASTKAAYEYFQKVYETDANLRNPVILTYIGVSQAIVASVGYNFIAKLKVFDKAMERIDTAVQTLTAAGADPYTMAHVYYLRGRVLAAAPGVVEVSKEAIPTLDTALEYFAKVEDLQKNDALAQTYHSYAKYYKTRNKTRARENMRIAIRKAESEDLREYLTQELEKLK